ncbi:MAG: tripartite tricarboxylate transporter TctB family protein [Deltaproteobacteria bacterium]|nr:tripartite tricarboxylate transporter TctB family protein [Deltaproteobacteria bacterium]
MERTQSQYDRISAIFFLIIGGFFALYARSVDIGTWHEPGPGFLPFWAGLTIGIMSLALLLKNLKRKGPVRPSFFPESESWKRVLTTFLALIVYNFVFDLLGFALTTFLFVGFLVKFIFPQSWAKTLIVALSAAIIARLLFINFLETQLPKGFLGF